MKKITTLLCCLIGITLSIAQENPQWLRYPTISPDGSQIVFTYKGDLYRVSSSGGEARQLTFHEAHDYMPVWSKDGQRLAFASDRYGNFDVFVMDAQGGPAQRLTFHSSSEKPFSFSADDSQVIFGGVRQDLAPHRQYPTGSQPELYQVPVKGGRVGQILTVPAEWVQVKQDGSQMIYHDKKGGENEWRKHHVSSITRDIWTYDPKTGKHQQITSFAGEDRHPVYSADESSIYYLSEANGNFNVYKKGLSASASAEQLTDFTLHPVRFLSRGGDKLCFSYDGFLYTLVEGQKPQKVPVTIRTQAIANKEKFININGGVREMDIS
ncbi:MAG: peptidase S41, partial [Bacteroidota bacterium]